MKPMTMQESMNNIKDFINDVSTLDQITMDQKGQFDDCLQRITAEIEILQDDRTPGATAHRQTQELTAKVLRHLERICYELPITDQLRDFVDSYALLIENWNRNLDQDQSTAFDAAKLRRLIYSHYTMIEAIEVLKFNVRRLNTFRNWLPPAFELSQHYFDRLDKAEHPDRPQPEE